MSISPKLWTYPQLILGTPIDPPNGGGYNYGMTQKKNKPTNPPIEYIPIVSKQLRWVSCRDLAECLYHSRLDLSVIEKIKFDIVVKYLEKK